MKRSRLEHEIEFRIKSAGFPPPVHEYKFCPYRRWRFDFAWPEKKIAVECEGGCWSGGRHTRGSGFIKDAEKYNCAVLMGWRVLRYPPTLFSQIIRDLQELKLIGSLNKGPITKKGAAQCQKQTNTRDLSKTQPGSLSLQVLIRP